MPPIALHQQNAQFKRDQNDQDGQQQGRDRRVARRHHRRSDKKVGQGQQGAWYEMHQD